VKLSTDERQLTRGTEREMYQEQRNHRRMLNEERPPRKVQNRKTIFTTATFVVNVGKLFQDNIKMCLDSVWKMQKMIA
jgi:hypothetical protein